MNPRRVCVPLLAAALCGVRSVSSQTGLTRFDAIWGSGPNDIWVVGSGPPPGTAVHWDGRAWKETAFGVEVHDLASVWGSGPRDIFSVGRFGTIVHFDGRRWTKIDARTDLDLMAVAGRSPTDVYALARSGGESEPGLMLHYDGRTWTPERLPIPFVAQGMVVTGSDVLVAGYVVKDPQPKERRLFGVLAGLSGGRWSVSGWDGQRLRDPLVGGIAWTSLSTAGPTRLLFGRKGTEVGDPEIAVAAGGTWKLLPPVPAGEEDQVGLAFIAGDGTPVALYEGGIGFARYVGGRWSAVRTGTEEGRPDYLRAAWGVSSADFYVLTEETIVRVLRDRPTVVYKSTVEVAREAEEAQERAAKDVEQAWERAAKDAEQEISRVVAEPAAAELGVPKYPGAKFDPRMSGEMSSSEDEYFVYTTADPVDKVVSFYERQTGKKALKLEGGFLIAVKGAAPWPELGVTIQPNAGTYPAAVKTMITIRRAQENE